MKMTILTRHLLIRRAFREKSIFTDYDYNERVFVFNLFISLSSNLMRSTDIFIMFVRHAFDEFRFIYVKRSCRKRIMFVFFIL